MGMFDHSSAWWAIGGGLIALVIYLGIIALSIWIFYLIIRTAVKNGILRAAERGAFRGMNPGPHPGHNPGSYPGPGSGYTGGPQ